MINRQPQSFTSKNTEHTNHVIAIAALFAALPSTIPDLASQFSFIRNNQKLITIVDLIFLSIAVFYLIWRAYNRMSIIIANKKKLVIATTFGLVILISMSYYANKVFSQETKSSPPNSSTKDSSLISVQEPILKTDDTEINKYTSPYKIREELKENSKDKFNPTINEKSSDNIFVVRKFKNIDDRYNPDTKSKLISTIQEDILSLTSTQREGNYAELNGNKLFTDQTEKAKKLEASLEKSFDPKICTEMAEAREKAYSIGKTRALAILLARDYSNLGNYYLNQNIKQEGFTYYTKAIEKYYDVIKFTQKNGTYQNKPSDIYYYIGQVFHSIGDINHIDVKWREESYLMATAFLEISYYAENNEFYPKYFAGMVNHKLIFISNKDSKNLYLLDSEKYYTLSLEETISKQTKLYLYQYIADVYNELGYFAWNHPKSNNVISPKEYWQKRDSLLKDVKNWK